MDQKPLIWWGRHGFVKAQKSKTKPFPPSKETTIKANYRSRLYRYLDGKTTFIKYISGLKEDEMGYILYVLLNTSYYQVTSNLNYYNSLRFLFKFLEEKGHFDPYIGLCELKQKKFFTELYKINPLIRTRHVTIIYNRNG